MMQLYSADAETAVVSALLLDQANLGQVGGLSYRDFYDRQLGALFRVLSENPGGVSSVSLADRAAAIYPGDYAGLIADLVRVRGFAASGLADAAEIVLDRSVRRQVQSLDLSDVLNPERPLDESLEGLIQTLRGMHPKSKLRGFVAADSLMPEILEQIEGRSGSVPAVSGMLDLDSLIYGLRGGRLITVAARSGLGKSLFAGQWAMGCVANGHRVGFLPLEMPQTEVLLRLLASQGGLNSRRLFDQRPLDNRELSELLSAMNWSQWPLLHFCDRTRNQAEIVFQIRRLKEENPDLRAIVIDYLHLIRPTVAREQKRISLAEITSELKEIAIDLDIDIMALSQVNRENANRKDKRPLESDISEADAIVHNSDVVILLHREDFYDPDTVEHGIVEVHVSKHRNGPTGTFKMLFDKETQTLRNMVKR